MKTYQALEIAKIITALPEKAKLKAIYDLAMTINRDYGKDIINDLQEDIAAASITYSGSKKEPNMHLTYTGSI